MEEIWKPVFGYDGLYEVSTFGRIKSISDRQWNIRILKIEKLWVYSRIWLSQGWIVKRFAIHRLVALHFIPNPLNLPCVLHKDETLDEGWSLYNWMDNLWWWTYSDNSKDREKKWRGNNAWKINLLNTNLWKFWIKHHNSKKISQYTQDWEFIKEWDCTMDVERSININHSNISYCCKWKIKTAGGFIWKYKNPLN